MKKYLLLLHLLFLFVITAIAQPKGTIDLSLQVVNEKGKYLSNAEVTFTEMTTGKVVKVKLDAVGRLKTRLDSGKVWQIDILKIRKNPRWILDAPPHGTRKIQKKLIYNYYNYLRETEPPVDRATLSLTTVTQKLKKKVTYDTQNGLVKISVRTPSNQPSKEIKVDLVCYKLNKIYSAKTNDFGEATFKLPLKQNYQIDIDGVENYSFIDLTTPRLYGKSFIYVPTNVQETIVNDTIRQSLPAKQGGTTARELISITLNEKGKGAWANENVYLRNTKTGRVYAGQTDTRGVIRFLVPKGVYYTIDFDWKKDVDGFDLTINRGIGVTGKILTYDVSKHSRLKKEITKEEVWRNLYERLNNRNTTKLFEIPLLPNTTPTTDQNAKWLLPPTTDMKQAILELTLEAPALKTNATHSSTQNICLVIDKSGSMYSCIEELKIALKTYISRLPKGSQVSIVEFNSIAYEYLPPTLIDKNQTYIKNQIDRLSLGGGTHIFNGLKKGGDLLTPYINQFDRSSMVLFTDGYGTGSTMDELISMMKGFVHSGIDYFGIGTGSFNRPFMTALATECQNYTPTETELDDVSNYLNEQLAATLGSPVYKDVNATITYQKVDSAFNITSWNVKPLPSSPTQIKFGTMYENQTVTRYFKFTSHDFKNSNINITTSGLNLNSGKTFSFKDDIDLTWKKLDKTWEKNLTAIQRRTYLAIQINDLVKKILDAVKYQSKEQLDFQLHQLSKLLQEQKKLVEDEYIEDLTKRVEEQKNYFNRIKSLLPDK